MLSLPPCAPVGLGFFRQASGRLGVGSLLTQSRAPWPGFLPLPKRNTAPPPPTERPDSFLVLPLFKRGFRCIGLTGHGQSAALSLSACARVPWPLAPERGPCQAAVGCSTSLARLSRTRCCCYREWANKVRRGAWREADFLKRAEERVHHAAAAAGPVAGLTSGASQKLRLRPSASEARASFLPDAHPVGPIFAFGSVACGDVFSAVARCVLRVSPQALSVAFLDTIDVCMTTTTPLSFARSLYFDLSECSFGFSS